MENQRLLLFVALSLVILLLYDAWQAQFGPQPAPATEQQAVAPGTQGNDNPPVANDTPAVPDATAQPPESPPNAVSSGQQADKAVPASRISADSSLESDKRIDVHTDVLHVTIDTVGGDIRRVALKQFPEQSNTPDKPIVLFDDRLPKIFIAQSGLIAKNGPSVDHHAVFSSAQLNYQLGNAENSLNVDLQWRSEDGLEVIKRYQFERDSYQIKMTVVVNNQSTQLWSGRMYRQLQRTKQDENQSSFIYTYTGGVVSSEANSYEKVNFDDMSTWKPESSYSKQGWVAMIQHYFLGAWIPEAEEYNYYYTNVVEANRFIIGLQTAETKVPAGQTAEFNSALYIGPKLQSRLKAVAPNLNLTVDYGVLTILADPLFWLLSKIHSYVNNWGWSIILVTLIVKLLFYKLSESAYRSMANMRKFQPKIQALKERYGDDRQRMSQAMMDIYKKEKLNPFGGCLPMLVQIPVFIALYWVLLESVELRQAPFILWINDLSTKDPYYILPLLMGVSMFIQQKLSPATLDPMQQKILSFLPIIFTLFFAFFPSGLVLYWVVNNVLSILQQWYITRKIEQQSAAKPA